MIIAGVNLATQLRATGSLSVSRELHDLNQTQGALSQKNGEIALALIVCKRASYPVDQIAGGNGEWWLNRE